MKGLQCTVRVSWCTVRPAPAEILAFITSFRAATQARLQDRTDGLRLALCAEQILLWGIPRAEN